MLSAFKYRIYPKPEQEMRLKRSLLLLCDLYNRLRAKKIEEYKTNTHDFSLNELRALALLERRSSAELQSVYGQAAQNVADRLHSSFTNFLGGRARFPKKKRSRNYLSLTYPQTGFRFSSKAGLELSCIGRTRMFIHRPLVGRVKRLTIKRDAGEWYAIFVVERSAPAKPPIAAIPKERIRGVDLGLEKFATLDNSESIEFPKFLRQSEVKIRTLQRRLSRKKRGSKRWGATCFSLARLHLHVKRQREDFQNKLVNKLLSENDALVLEKLGIPGMLRNHSLAKSISDAAWGRFASKAIFKAGMLGKYLIAVDPWGTTQFCHNCLALGVEEPEPEDAQLSQLWRTVSPRP